MCAAEMWMGDGQCDDAATGSVGNLACKHIDTPHHNLISGMSYVRCL